MEISLVPGFSQVITVLQEIENHFNANDILDSSRMSFDHLVGSAEGAGFNSHGRKAVAGEPQDENDARRADISSLRINAAPSALNYSCFGAIHGLTAVAI